MQVPSLKAKNRLQARLAHRPAQKVYSPHRHARETYTMPAAALRAHRGATCTLCAMVAFAAAVSLTLQPAHADLDAFCEQVADEALYTINKMAIICMRNDPGRASGTCDDDAAERF